MTLRILALAVSALMLSAGVVTADAAPRHRAKHHSAMHQASMRHGRMGTTMRRGRDGESAAVDQLNAQSLSAARGGSAPAAQ